MTGADAYEIRLLHAVIWLSLTTYAGRIMILSAVHFTTDYITWRMCYDSLL